MAILVGALGASLAGNALAQSSGCITVYGAQTCDAGKNGRTLTQQERDALMQQIVQQDKEVLGQLGATPAPGTCAAAIAKADAIGRPDLSVHVKLQCGLAKIKPTL